MEKKLYTLHSVHCGQTIRNSHPTKCIRLLHKIFILKYPTEYILIIVQRDATQSGVFITLQVHSTCFGCQPHPSPGVHKTVTTASGTGHTSLQLSHVWPRWR